MAIQNFERQAQITQKTHQTKKKKTTTKQQTTTVATSRAQQKVVR
jgi:hypothetical protein